MAADWIFTNGRVLTLDPRRPVAAALAIQGESILTTGSTADVRRRRDRRTRVLDLRGATVIPGLVDTHAHLDREGLKLLYPSLARCRSIADIQALLRREATRRPAGEWIVTMPLGAPPFYLDQAGGLAEKRWPTRADLDAAAPDHPVYIRGIWGYWNKPPVYSVANSMALARAGVTRDTEAPRGVEILQDAAGEPTGLFVEHNLIQVLEFTLLKAAPRFTPADRRRALIESQRRYAARGVTAVYEGHGVAPEVLRVYREAHEQGRLALRCTLALSPTWADADEGERLIPDLAAWAGGRGTGDDRLRVAGLCLHYGGDTEVARILHASQPYTGWAGFVESANAPEAYRRQAEAAARHGLRVSTLITRSLPEVLSVWETIARTAPIDHLRWVAVHLNVADAGQARATEAAWRSGHDQPDQLSLALGRGRGRQGAGARTAATAREPGPAAHTLRGGHRQQGRSLAGLRGHRRPARHAIRRRARTQRAPDPGAGPARAHGGRSLGDLRRARAWRRRPRPPGRAWPCSTRIRSRCRSRRCPH